MSTITPDTPLECNVCCDTYTKTLRKQIICPVCYYDVCKSCLKTYFLGSVKDFHCMKCEKGWTNDFVINSLGKSFITGDYKKHKANVLVDIEFAKIPDTMMAASRETNLRKYRKELQKIDDEIKRIEGHLLGLYDNKKALRRRFLYTEEKDEKEKEEEDGHVKNTNKHIIHCTKDDCNGLLSKTYKCHICDTKHCNKCHRLKEEEHECNDDDVETVNYIISQTKPCPKCGTRISKIDGCDQMWCISCHVAFSWNTGDIQKGMIHNPHYHEFLRQLADKEPDNVPLHECNAQVPRERTFYNKIRRVNISQQRRAQELYRFYCEMGAVQEMANSKIRQLEENEYIRVQYILGDFDKDQFKRIIVNKSYKLQRELDKVQLINIIISSLREIIIGIYNAHSDHVNDIIVSEYNKFLKLFEYCRDQFVKIGKLYKIKPIELSIYEYTNVDDKRYKFMFK